MNPPAAPASRPPQWLTLGEASRFLGVDASTLRAWADAGRIPTFRTPGGHRRFAQDALAEFLRRGHAEREVRLAEVIGSRGARLVQEASREEIRKQPWYAALDARTSEVMRRVCLRLMDALVGYLAGGRKQAMHLRGGQRAGRALGVQVAHLGLTPAEATRAFLFFRTTITDAVTTKLPLPPDRRVTSLRRIDAYLNSVLLEMMNAYQHRRRE